jgi:hypothetical protein
MKNTPAVARIPITAIVMISSMSVNPVNPDVLEITVIPYQSFPKSDLFCLKGNATIVMD